MRQITGGGPPSGGECERELGVEGRAGFGRAPRTRGKWQPVTSSVRSPLRAADVTVQVQLAREPQQELRSPRPSGDLVPAPRAAPCWVWSHQYEPAKLSSVTSSVRSEPPLPAGPCWREETGSPAKPAYLESDEKPRQKPTTPDVRLSGPRSVHPDALRRLPSPRASDAPPRPPPAPPGPVARRAHPLSPFAPVDRR